MNLQIYIHNGMSSSCMIGKTIINEHKQGRLTDEEYYKKILKTVRMHDLPKTRRVLLRALMSDSDSDWVSRVLPGMLKQK